MKRIIGICSLCGGNVLAHDNWSCVIPDIPTCADCGAESTWHTNKQVIPMTPKPKRSNSGTVYKTNIDVRSFYER